MTTKFKKSYSVVVGGLVLNASYNNEYDRGRITNGSVGSTSNANAMNFTRKEIMSLVRLLLKLKREIENAEEQTNAE